MDLHGKNHVVKSVVGSSYGPQKGAAIAVCYNPDNPKDVIMGSLALSFIARLLPVLVGAALMFFAYLAFKYN